MESGVAEVVHLCAQMTGQEQAQLHFTVAQGLAAAYVLFTRATGAPSPRFDLELVRLGSASPSALH